MDDELREAASPRGAAGEGSDIDLSIVVPVFDEAGNIRPVVDELLAATGGLGRVEVIFVDDGSRDETPAILARVAAERPAVRVLRHRRNAGKSAALWTGVEAARGEWIVTFDGDGQNDPADIARLVAARDAATAEGVRLVAGIRRRRADTALKRASSRIANRVRRRILGDGVRDTACGLKLIERKAYLELPYFDHMHRFLPALIQRDGGRVVSVDVADRRRISGTSKYGLHNRLWTGIADMLGVLWLQRRALGDSGE